MATRVDLGQVVGPQGPQGPAGPAGPEDMAMYVVESGTLGGWRYRKWSDGIAECERQITLDISSNWSTTGKVNAGNQNANKSIWRKIFSISLPSGLFVEKPYFMVATADWDLYTTADNPSGWTTTNVSLMVCSGGGQAVDQESCIANILIKGKWKN